MEFGRDLISTLRDRIGADPGSNAGPLLDWAGLHARLVAGYDMQRELALQASPDLAPVGSFDRSAAAALAGAGHGSYLVNPTDLADGKDPSSIVTNVAGEPNVGDRGK